MAPPHLPDLPLPITHLPLVALRPQAIEVSINRLVDTIPRTEMGTVAPLNSKEGTITPKDMVALIINNHSKGLILAPLRLKAPGVSFSHLE